MFWKGQLKVLTSIKIDVFRTDMKGEDHVRETRQHPSRVTAFQ